MKDVFVKLNDLERGYRNVILGEGKIMPAVMKTEIEEIKRYIFDVENEVHDTINEAKKPSKKVSKKTKKS